MIFMRRVVAEISIIPLGKGASVSKYVKKAIEVFKKYNLKVEPSAMGTVLEGDLDEILKILSLASHLQQNLLFLFYYFSLKH